MRTIVAIYDTEEEARDAVEALIDAGFRRENISIATRTEGEEVAIEEPEEEGAGEGAAEGAGLGAVVGGLAGVLIGLSSIAVPGLGAIAAAGPLAGLISGAVTGAVAGGIIGALVELGVPEEEAEVYAEAVRRGATLVAVRVADEDVSEAQSVLHRFNPVDIERREQRWREEGWAGFDEEEEPWTLDEIEEEREVAMEEEEMYQVEADEATEFEVVEEEVRVGKREVETGHVRVRTYVVEEPVEEQINLRRERVEVEREPVDRVAEDVDWDEEEEVIEVEATSEEAVVDKEARVTEQVRVTKEVEEETETVEETVRRREVEIERIGTEEGLVEGVVEDEDEWMELEPDFRRHYQTSYARTGRDWSYYRPAYRYGYKLAQQYRDKRWAELEPEARRRWEALNEPGSWDEAQDAVRAAYVRHIA